MYTDFIGTGMTPVYMEVTDRKKLKDLVNEKLVEYNKANISMDIVMFQDAISYMIKIYRILKMGKGHALLVGEGGSGRHSLSKLSSFIARYEKFQITVTKGYGVNAFRDDIKKISKKWGIKNKSGIFLFSDGEIIKPQFIEDVNNILCAGEVPNLWGVEEKQGIITALEKRAKKFLGKKSITDEEVWELFRTRLKSNFHIVFCMAQTGDNLRNYTRMYPGLVNNTTTIWF